MSAYPNSPGFKEVAGTSQLAARNLEKSGRLVALRNKVLAVFNYLDQTRAGLTADECAELMHESVLSIRPRCSELFQKGELEKTGQVRPNATGSLCRVYRRRIAQ